jgi:hypothetical protein
MDPELSHWILIQEGQNAAPPPPPKKRKISFLFGEFPAVSERLAPPLPLPYSRYRIVQYNPSALLGKNNKDDIQNCSF